MTEPVFFNGPESWRSWLATHHQDRSECLVGFVKVGTGRATMTWSEAVDEALCFGWIDGVRRGVDADSYTIRFTPRKPASTWSAVNVKKVEALRSAGRMTPAGEQAFAARSDAKTAIYSYEKAPATFRPDQLAAFRDDQPAWAFWTAQPPWYRRVATHWVTDAKREPTRAKRLAQLIADSHAQRRLRQYSR